MIVLAMLLALSSPAPTPSPGLSAVDLWRAADTADHVARDYPRAVSLYSDLLTRFPDSRLSRAAESRRDYVARAIADGGEEPFRRFETVKSDFASLGPAAAEQQVRQLLADFPHWQLDDELLLWLADRAAEAGRVREARDLYQRVLDEHPDSPQKGYAFAGLGRTDFALGDYPGAERAFAAIAGTGLVSADYVSQLEVARVEAHVQRRNRERAMLAILAAIALAALATVDRRRVASAVRRAAGRELLYLGPALALLVLLSPADGRIAVAAVAGAGLAWMLLALVWAEAARPALARPGPRVVAAVLGVAGGMSLLYSVMYSLDLLVAVERLGG